MKTHNIIIQKVLFGIPAFPPLANVLWKEEESRNRKNMGLFEMENFIVFTPHIIS